MQTVGVPLYRVQTFFTGSPVSDGLNSLFFDAAEGTPGQANAAANAFWESARGLMYTAQTATVSGTVDLINEATGVLVDSTGGPDTAHVGANAASPLPPYTQMLCRLITGTIVNGRRLQGRFFIPGLTEDHNVTPGVPSSASHDAIEDALELLATGADHQLVVWHRPVDGAGGSKAAVTGTNVAGQWGVLRKRRPDIS